MNSRIHWKDGDLLDALSFSTRDVFIQQAIAESIHLPYQMAYGVVSLDIDMDMLTLGKVDVNSFNLYTKDKRLLVYSKDSQPLALDLEEYESTGEVSIYLNAHEAHLTQNGVDLLSINYNLSIKPVDSAIHFIKLLEITHTNDGWTLNDYTPALISCGSCTFSKVIIELEKIYTALGYLSTQYDDKSQLHLLLQTPIYELGTLLHSIRKAPVHFHPYELYQSLCKIHSILEKKPYTSICYDFYYPHRAFDALIRSFHGLLKKPIKQQFIELVYEDNAYLYMNLHNDLLASSQLFFVIKKKQSTTPDFDTKSIRLSNISRNNYINQMSLTGVNLDYIPDTGIHQLNDPSIYQTFRLLPGQELDYILDEKNIMFESKQHDNYRFFVYYR